MKNVFFRYFLSTCAILMIWACDADAQGLKKIIWGQTSISSSQWIPWIAKDAKLYEKYGLDVDIVYLRGGSGDTSKALVAGSIFAAPVTTATVMTANLAGADLTPSLTLSKRFRAKSWRDLSSRDRKTSRVKDWLVRVWVRWVIFFTAW